MLKMMVCKYDRECYLEFVGKIKVVMLNVLFIIDIIVGFLNEIDEQFEEIFFLYCEVEFDSVYMFIYFFCEGMFVVKMKDNVLMRVKKECFQCFNDLVKEIFVKKMKEYEGWIVEVLVEGESKNNFDIFVGYMEKSKFVNFKGLKDVIGKIVCVKIEQVKIWLFDGVMVGEVIEVK